MKKLYLFIFAVVITLAFSHTVFAGDTTGSAPSADTSGSGATKTTVPSVIPGLENPLKAKNVTGVLLSVTDLIIFIGVIVAVLMFIWIGFKFVLAQGDPTKLKEAKEWFMYAAIGTAILISSKVIVQVVQSTLTSAGVVNEDLFKTNKL